MALAVSILSFPGKGRAAPEAQDDWLMLTWHPVSPDGRYVLTYLSLPDDSADHPQAVVDWQTGKTGIWRRIPFGIVVAWNPLSVAPSSANRLAG